VWSFLPRSEVRSAGPSALVEAVLYERRRESYFSVCLSGERVFGMGEKPSKFSFLLKAALTLSLFISSVKLAESTGTFGEPSRRLVEDRAELIGVIRILSSTYLSKFWDEDCLVEVGDPGLESSLRKSETTIMLLLLLYWLASILNLYSFDGLVRKTSSISSHFTFIPSWIVSESLPSCSWRESLLTELSAASFCSLEPSNDRLSQSSNSFLRRCSCCFSLFCSSVKANGLARVGLLFQFGA